MIQSVRPSPRIHMQHGLVISDLHLFSRRSRAEFLLESMKGELETVEILVLNGDVFDFRWSTLPDMETTIAAALRWLAELLTMRADRQVHYLLGNHDCMTGFTEKLSDLERASPSLKCHESHLLLGRNLFLHGDCANRRMDAADFQSFRKSWSSDKQRGPIGRALYDGVDAMGISRKFHDLWFPQQTTVRRVAHHLDHILPEWREDIDHCYFGHTHLPFTKYSHERVMFHNTGSAIRDMGFLPLPFTCTTSTARS